MWTALLPTLVAAAAALGSNISSAAAARTAAAPRPQLLIYEGPSSDMSAMTAIGLLNRPPAARPFSGAYASFGWENHHSRDWLEEAVASDPQLRGVQTTNTTNSSVVIEHAMASGAAAGFVLYNSSEGADLLPTVLTLCAVHDAVAIDCHRVPVPLQCGGGGGGGSHVIFDARGRWSDNLTAGAWAASYLLPHTASNDLMVVVDPGVVAEGYLVDIAVSRKLFVMANKVCTPFSPANELFERVSESAHWDRHHLLSIMGCEHNRHHTARGSCFHPIRTSIALLIVAADACVHNHLRPHC
eukprot:SAG11_NODE_2601_length_3182_cov_2.460590_2_plen_299_part_00